MDNINNEISSLQSKINELEKLKKEKEQEELKKKQSVDHNLSIINNILVNNKQNVQTYDCQRRGYTCSKQHVQAINNYRNLIKYLEPIYNSLQIMNERLNKLENDIQQIS